MSNYVFIKSMEAKLILSQETIPYYQSLKDVCSLHAGVKSRLSFHKESIYFNKKKIAIIKVSRKNIAMYLALEPSKYSNYKIKDVTTVKAYSGCPSMLWVDSKKTLKNACFLLEEALIAAGATTIQTALVTDYQENFYPRSFEELYNVGLIKRYNRKAAMIEVDDEDDLLEVYNVHFTCRLLYDAKNTADNLYIVTNTNDWNVEKAVKMNKTSDNTYEADMLFAKDTYLEFKICKDLSWDAVEKGIWKEEIINHNYVIVDNDLEVEDLIHNFR